MKIRNTLITLVLTATAASAHALSLGRVRGAAVLGQPLALTFEIKADVGEEVVASCFEALVMQGDSRLDPSRMRWSVSGEGAGILLSLQSSVVIEEPAVVVTLKAACEQKSSRRYVLLTELPGEPKAAAPSPASVLRTREASSKSVPGPVEPVPNMVRTPEAPALPLAQALRAKRSEPAEARQSVSRAKATAAPPAEDKRRKMAPRLRLDGAELAVDREAVLRLSPGLSVLPQEEAVAQREQAKALWSALNLPLEQALERTRLLQKMETDVAALRVSAQKASVNAQALEQRLQESEEARFQNPLVYGLAGLSLLLAVGCGWLGFRQRRGVAPAKWWQVRGGRLADTSLFEPSHLVGDDDQPGAVAAPAPPAAGDSLLNSRVMEHVDVELDLSESAFRRLEDPQSTPLPEVFVPVEASVPTPTPAPSLHQPAVVGAPTPDDLFDVQQHAEFYVSLGQYEQATDALRAFIAKHPDACPLAYLDLLKVCHMLSQTDEFERVREDFNQRFSGQIPVFSGFGRPGRGLEAYPQTLARIEQAWSQADALAVLEDCAFRPHAVAVGELLDLEAFKDLLVLHAVKATTVGGGGERRILSGDLSGVWQSTWDEGTAQGSLVPEDLRSAVPVSGWDRYAPGPAAQESVLDLDLSELPVGTPPTPMQATWTPPDLSEPLMFEPVALPDPAVGAGAKGLESPLDAPAAALNPHLLDFDIFDAGVTTPSEPDKAP